MRSKSTASLLCILTTAAVLSACASKPQISSQQESTQYLSRAGRDYTPPGPASDPWGPYIHEAAGKYDVPERWIREVMRQESGGRLYGRGGQLITSGAGAMGLMQVMPATYDDLKSRYRELGDDPFDPHNNIMAGTAYIREMYDIYGAPGFLAAYNAGPGRLDDYLTRNRTLPEETRRYVASIGPRIAGAEPRTPSPGQQYAMNAVPFSIPEGPRYAASEVRYAAASAAPAPIVLNPPRAEPVQVAQAPILLPPPREEPVASAPVQVAAVSNGFIKLNPPAAFEPMAPIQVAEEIPEPPRPAPRPERAMPVFESEPVPVRARSQEFARPAEPARSLLAAASRPASIERLPERLPEPPLPVPPRPTMLAQRPYFTPPSSRPIEVAEFAPRMSRQAPAQLAAAELVPVAPHQHTFGLIPSANAAPIHHPAAGGPSTGAWGVQVGAFANQSLAAAATTAARENVRDVLGAAHPVVAGVRQQGGTLYRARLTGLSRDAAAHACERLSRARTSCMVVSPDAQS